MNKKGVIIDYASNPTSIKRADRARSLYLETRLLFLSDHRFIIIEIIIYINHRLCSKQNRIYNLIKLPLYIR